MKLLKKTIIIILIIISFSFLFFSSIFPIFNSNKIEIVKFKDRNNIKNLIILSYEGNAVTNSTLSLYESKGYRDSLLNVFETLEFYNKCIGLRYIDSENLEIDLSYLEKDYMESKSIDTIILTFKNNQYYFHRKK